MNKKYWFYNLNNDTSLKYRTAYEKSLNNACSVKVHSGVYFYKGYEINYDREREKGYQWEIDNNKGIESNEGFYSTKRDCMLAVDELIAIKQEELNSAEPLDLTGQDKLNL